jgi:hypothetical protein
MGKESGTMGKEFAMALSFALFGGAALAQEAAPVQASPAELLGREHKLVVTTNPDTYLTNHCARR